MKTYAVLTVLAVLATGLHGPCAAEAQVPPPMPAPALQTAPQELDAMLAPIALYPDPLVAQILMAATYPLEVVEADRWLQEPANAALTSEQLVGALDQQAWDPSVKSLVPFPQILHMMDSNLDWTERIGNAFLADEAAVMDAVQRLRQRAQAAGKLVSSPQQDVSTNDGVIEIEPADPGMVYVPVYDPALVYGLWPYPAFPPFYFPEFFGGVIVGGIGFGWIGFATRPRSSSARTHGPIRFPLSGGATAGSSTSRPAPSRSSSAGSAATNWMRSRCAVPMCVPSTTMPPAIPPPRDCTSTRGRSRAPTGSTTDCTGRCRGTARRARSDRSLPPPRRRATARPAPRARCHSTATTTGY